MSAYWNITDAGRSNSDRGRTKRGIQKQERNDCAVRALALAFGVSYDAAHEYCERELGRQRGKGCHLDRLLRKTSDRGQTILGKSVRWVSCPAVAGQPRTDAHKLLSSGALNGRVAIIREAHHVYAVISGVAHDTAISYAGRCVYGYFIIG